MHHEQRPPAALARAILREQTCQATVASLTHELMMSDGSVAHDPARRADADDLLAQATAEWHGALEERRRLEAEHALDGEMRRLRSKVTQERSEMTWWERWREARRYRREMF